MSERTIESYMDQWGYASVEEWARDSDLTEGADGEWRDDEGNVQCVWGALEGAIEAYELAMESERDRGSWTVTEDGTYDPIDHDDHHGSTLWDD